MNTKTKARMHRTAKLLSGVETRLRKAIDASEKLKHPRAEDLNAAQELRRLCTQIKEVRAGVVLPVQPNLPL